MRWLKELIERIFRGLAGQAERCIPKYNPALWNDNNGIQSQNNCYNYACDIRTDTYAQPGRATGHMYSRPIECRGVAAGATSDGLVWVDPSQGCGCSECRHRVALVVAPNHDYHWYRLDRDGRWSHKPGWGEATNLDSSGNTILDPQAADIRPYTVFCGFYCVKKSTVTIN